MSRLIKQPSRGFDIITNESTPLCLPKIASKNSSIYDTQKSGASHQNRSNYNFDIITSRALPQTLALKENNRISNKKVYAITKFSQDTYGSSMRFRDEYDNYTCNKRFNRKKGLVDEFLGKEVNTITGWLKKQ